MTITTFIAVYRGPTVGAAKLVALSADPELIEEFVAKLLPTNSTDGPCETAELQFNEIINEK